MSTNLSRRKFLIRAAAGTGAACLACSGLTALAFRAPAIDFTETFSSGENTMNQKVLVAYASRSGSTMEVAHTVAQELTNRGYAVDVRMARQVANLDGYTAVVVGSAIRYSQWLPEAVKFVQQNQAALNQMPTAFFAVHLMNMGDDETSRKARQAYLDPVRKLVAPKAEAYFAGVGDLSKVSFLERLIAKAVKSPEGDFRDWSKIRSWAQSII